MKQIIRLTESDLHRVVKESVKRILGELKNDILVDPADQIPTEQAEQESSIMCTFLFNEKRLVFAPSAQVIPDDMPDDEWCSIIITPVLGNDSEGFYVDDLIWDFDEVNPNLANNPHLQKMIDNAIEENRNEIIQKIMENSRYF